MGRGKGDFPAGGVDRAVAAKSQQLPPEVDPGKIENLSPTIRIVNRAEKGPCAKKGFIGVWNGTAFPYGADPDDADSFLQPGESMDIPREAALHICGNLWDAKLADKQRIISRYGGYEYEDCGPVSGRVATMKVVGPPPVPDLVAIEVNGKGKPIGEARSMWDLYKLDATARR